MTYTVFDLETGIHNRGEDAIGTMQASPFHPDNKIVLGGYKKANGNVEVVPDRCKGQWDVMLAESSLLIGHNIKFDLLYLRKTVGDEAYYEWIRRGGTIWDTQQAEYLLSGQVKQYVTLDDCSLKYGGELKDDKIKEYWDNGVDTEDIPQQELQPYLIGDVLNTEIVYKAQLKRAKQIGMLALIETQNDAVLATTDIEWNGMKIDYKVAKAKAAELRTEIELIDPQIRPYFEKCLDRLGDDINIGSAHQLSKVLFGGTYKVKVDEVVNDDDGNPIIYKSGKKKGKVRTRKAEVKVTTQGLGLTPGERTETKVKGIYKTDDEVMSSIDHPLAHLITTQRALLKDLTTYFEPFCNLAWPTDGCVHGKLNHNSTVTGRLSSSAPNCQNLSGKDRD